MKSHQHSSRNPAKHLQNSFSPFHCYWKLTLHPPPKPYQTDVFCTVSGCPPNCFSHPSVLLYLCTCMVLITVLSKWPCGMGTRVASFVISEREKLRPNLRVSPIRSDLIPKCITVHRVTFITQVYIGQSSEAMSTVRWKTPTGSLSPAAALNSAYFWLLKITVPALTEWGVPYSILSRHCQVGFMFKQMIHKVPG